MPGMAGGCRLALYIYLLIGARHAGPQRGKVAMSFADLALFLGVHYQTVYKAAQWLEEEGYITYKPTKNQYGVTVFTVTKYKTVADFLALSPETESEVNAKKRRGKSKSRTASKSKGLQDPNNDKEYKEIYSGEVEEVFDAYNTIMEIRSRSDSRKSKIRARLQEYGKDGVLRAIENYHRVLDDPINHWTHRFPVEDFMTPKNVDRFLSMEPPAEEKWEEMPVGSGR